jgi:nitrile hydratase accessory protein
LSLPETAPGLGDPVFAEPWQAQIFALTLALNEREVFTWAEWAETLGGALKGAALDGSDYYERWLAALEGLLIQKNIATAPEVAELTAAWHRAAEATPHGKPILLDNDPMTSRASLQDEIPET